MPALIGFPSPQTINRVIREWEPDPSRYIGGQILPLNSKDFLETPTHISWDILPPAVGMTKPHTLDSTPALVKMPGLKNKSMGTGYWKESAQLNESDMLILRGFGPDHRKRAARDKVVRLQETLQARLAVRMEWLRWQALLGQLSVNENGVILDVDYEIPAGNKWQVNVSWADTANAKPIDDFMAVETKYEGLGATAKFYVMNRATAVLLAKNAQVRDLVKQSIRVEDIALGNVEKLVLQLAGVPGTVVIYNEGYFNDSATFTKFIPDNKVIVIGEGLGKTAGELGFFGSTPNLHNSGGMDNPQAGPFMLVKDRSMSEENPFYKLTMGIYGLPVVIRPYWIQIITVVF